MNERQLQELLKSNPDITIDDRYTVNAIGEWDIGRNVKLGGAERRMTEHEMQKLIFAECDRRSLLNPDWAMVAACPNGQYRHGQRMEPGLKSGFPDIMCLVPRLKANVMRHGMFIELKVKPNKPTPEQELWLRKLRVHGYVCHVVYDDPFEAIGLLEWWIGI